MNLKVVEKSDNRILVLLKKFDLCVVNALRRVLIGEIGCYAFDEIEIKKNTTIFHNEFLKHRIGLIPLKFNAPITFRTNVINETGKEFYVTSNSLKCLDMNHDYKVMPNIPLLVLRKGEEIDFVAKSKKGLGKDDIKYSMVTNTGFVRVRKVKGVVDEIKPWVVEGDLYYGRKYLLTESKVDYEITNDYCMWIETIMYDADYVLIKAIKKLITMLEDGKKLEIEILENKGDIFYRYKINGIDYIEGNILTTYLLKRDNVKVATYTKKHLLDNYFEFKLELEKAERLSLLKIKEEVFDKVINEIDTIIER